MKLKNITNSIREIKDIFGKAYLVKPNEIINLNRPIINNCVLNSFKIIKPRKVKKSYKGGIKITNDSSK